jgi:MFS family permease
VRQIAIVAAAYPVVWGAGQLLTGWASDHIGREPLMTAGMLVQAAALALLVAGGGAHPVADRGDRARRRFAIGALIAGVGADLISPAVAIVVVATLTAASGLIVARTPWQRPSVPGPGVS